MVRIRGAAEHSRRLKRIMGAGLAREVGEGLFAAGKLIQADARDSITEGSVSGDQHVPSRPGEPPNADTHRLSDNIELVQPQPLRVEVSSNAPYSADLEFGTSKMAARPFMKPAATRRRDEAVRLVREQVSALIRKSKGA
ncbi:MAG: HK97-gp10 family putative phage morphogenesis protein [Sphingobium sp.]